MMSKKATFVTRLAVVLLALAMCFSFAACAADEDTDRPSDSPKVNSVTIKYEGETVGPALSALLTDGSIKVTAEVSKDDGADGELKFTSSDTAVATVDNTGNITLIGEGDTVITASFGDKGCSFTLTVSAGSTVKYTVTVTGGTADKAEAGVGETVTLTPGAAETGKEFKKWKVKGDKTLWASPGTQRVELENPVNHSTNKTGVYYSPTSNAISATVTNEYGWTTVATYEHWIDQTPLPCVMTAQLSNLPEYDASDPYLTVYVKMINHAASDHTYNYKFALGTNINPLDGENNIRNGSVAAEINVSNHGEVQIVAIRVPRAPGDTVFYFSMVKIRYDTADNSIPAISKPYYAMNYSLVLTYNNGIGFDGEVTE